MDTNLMLVAYLFPGLAVVFGIPMALGLVPPNRFYGYRTRRTLSSAEIWYPANRACGWAMIAGGALAIAHNLYFRQTHAEWAPATQQLFMTVSTALVMLGALVFSALYVRKL